VATKLLVVFACMQLALFSPGQLSAAGPPADSLADLLKLYQEVGLPLPPKDAKLVRSRPDSTQLHLRTTSGLFIVIPDFVFGSYAQDIGGEQAKEIEPTIAALEDTPGYEASVIQAVQFRSLGWQALADEAFKLSQMANQDSLRDELLQAAWAYWYRQLTQPNIDRRPISGRLKQLQALSPDLNTSANKNLIQSLDLALSPRKSKPGSIQASIDDLVDLDASGTPSNSLVKQGPYANLANLGFEAVPAMLENLDDARLTRAMYPYPGKSEPRIMLVRDVVKLLLEDLAGIAALRKWRMRILDNSDRSFPLMKSDVQAWWREAQKVGEEHYLLEHLLIENRDLQWPNENNLHLLARKYPRSLRAAYLKILDQKPLVQSWPAVDEIVESSLSNKEKLQLLLQGAAREQSDHHRPAREALERLDPKEFNSLRPKTADGFPKPN
jgi:hypothetical protein